MSTHEALDVHNTSLQENITHTNDKDLETRENIYRFLKSLLIYGSLSALYMATATKIFIKLRLVLTSYLIIL